MSNIILPISYTDNGIALVSTLDFAEGLHIQHKSLLETIRGYLPAIEKDFGRVTFETRPFETAGGTQYREIALLTEDQSLFIGSLSRNSERVVEFKSVLVRSFAEARRLLQQKALPSYQIDDPIKRAEVWIAEQKEKQLLLAENEALRPKAAYAEAVLSSTTELTTTVIAQELGMSAVRLNKELHMAGVQYKQRGTWVLYSVHVNKGYANLKTHAYTDSSGKAQTKHYLVWTETGREFIHRMLNRKLIQSTSLTALRLGSPTAHA